jgi:hypothetical protein
VKKIGRALQSQLFVLLLIVGAFAQANDINVSSYVDRNQLGLGETITLTVQVNSSESIDVREPRFPDLEGFDLLNTYTDQSSSANLTKTPSGMQFVTQKRFRYNYVLAPQRHGVFSIGAFEVIVDGKKYLTKPIRISVKRGPGQSAPIAKTPQQQENEDKFADLLKKRSELKDGYISGPRNTNEAFFVQIQLDKTEVYEGEQILAKWFILARGQVERIERLKFPTLKGFWKEDIEAAPPTRFSQKIINGIVYREAPLASHALFPIKPGTATIDEYQVKATVRMSSGQFGVFSFGKPYTYTKPSERVKITVKPLPQEGRPPNFSGAVGNFQMFVSTDINQVKAGEPFTIKVKFEGYGNAKLIDLPPLDMPPSFEVYSQQSNSKYYKSGKSYKEFEVILIPREVGEFSIPAISTAVFNPDTEQYEQKVSDEIPVKVLNNPNAPKATGQSFTDLANSKEAKVQEVKEEYPALSVAKSGSKRGLWGFGLVSFAGYGLAIVFALLFGWKDLFFADTRIDYGKLVEERLREMRKANDKGDWRKVGAQCSHLIFLVLGKIAGVGGGSDQLKNIVDSLPPSVRKSIEGDVFKLVEEAQLIGFAPEELAKKYSDKKEMKTVLGKVESLLKKVIKASA